VTFSARAISQELMPFLAFAINQKQGSQVDSLSGLSSRTPCVNIT
jgi:hypothetical protein